MKRKNILIFAAILIMFSIGIASWIYMKDYTVAESNLAIDNIEALTTNENDPPSYNGFVCVGAFTYKYVGITVVDFATREHDYTNTESSKDKIQDYRIICCTARGVGTKTGNTEMYTADRVGTESEEDCDATKHIYYMEALNNALYEVYGH